MTETLERWAPRVGAALRGLADTMLRELAERTRATADAVRRRAPQHVQISAATQTSGTSLAAEGDGAGLLDHGGTVRGRPWVAVPVGPRIAVRGPRLDGDLFALRSRDGRVFLASRRGGALDVRWRLIRSVTVRGSHYLSGPAEELIAEAPRRMLDAGDAALGVS